jgi:hypothetical protein
MKIRIKSEVMILYFIRNPFPSCNSNPDEGVPVLINH